MDATGMTYRECNQSIRRILSEVNDDCALGLVDLLGDMEYGVLEKVLASEITRFIAANFILDSDSASSTNAGNMP